MAGRYLMQYYRMLLKKENGNFAVSDITKHKIDDQTFIEMNWDKPIIRHFDGGVFHFIALSREYLEILQNGIFIGSEMVG